MLKLNYEKFQTIEVKVGSIGIGGLNPIRIQSMTTTETMNVEKTIAQSIRMIQNGCELVRITAPSINEARKLIEIKDGLRKKGFDTPIVADIHFTPNAAEEAAKNVEKVRINPGNFIDKKKFESVLLTEDEYQKELERIELKLIPLLKICKENNTALRIGSNHGSLSDRILSKYGDTPLGMVESALEFARICIKHHFNQIVFSMKASNVKIMVYAYRLLVSKMKEEGMKFPIHLGVTEAGDGMDGRVKSSVGIGLLLEEGIGDTIRVSLTEEPEFEMDVCKVIVNRTKINTQLKEIEVKNIDFDPFNYKNRETNKVKNIGSITIPRVFSDLSNLNKIETKDFENFGYFYNNELDKWQIKDLASDFVYIGRNKINFEIPEMLGIIKDYEIWKLSEIKKTIFPLLDINEFSSEIKLHPELNFINLTTDIKNIEKLFKIKDYKNIVLILNSSENRSYLEYKQFFFKLMEKEIKTPVILRKNYKTHTEEEFTIYSSIDIGSLYVNGFGNGIWLNSDTQNIKHINEVSFNILQATGSRISKTEYISCPSCGRTLFDLQETTNKIRNRTSHLKGLKIGIMGCIVNGPGEMADAHFGYVGSGIGKINLYKGREVIKKNVPTEHAVDELITLIKENNLWKEPI